MYDTTGHAFIKSTFPLQLAYAMTGHKSQGATLTGSPATGSTHTFICHSPPSSPRSLPRTGTTIINVDSAFCPGLLYVMLSRVTHRSQLRLLQPLTPDMFTPMLVRGL